MMSIHFWPLLQVNTHHVKCGGFIMATCPCRNFCSEGETDILSIESLLLSGVGYSVTSTEDTSLNFLTPSTALAQPLKYGHLSIKALSSAPLVWVPLYSSI